MKPSEWRFPEFTERFRELRGERDNTEFGKFLSISRQTVGFYCNGDRIPDALGLKQIAEKCGVSADWLLGLSEFKTIENRHSTFALYNQFMAAFSTAVLEGHSKMFYDAMQNILDGYIYSTFDFGREATANYVAATKILSEAMKAASSCLQIASQAMELNEHADQDTETMSQINDILEQASLAATRAINAYTKTVENISMKYLPMAEDGSKPLNYYDKASALLKESNKRYLVWLENEAG
ncbi:MAG TPA: helix-turn-helix transcriptional regulator, partial [Candidatus Scatomorpha intestinavium]|nr:helix-turn-helix transcriptional regulator [Candidatus Scatomorpha intestinavium]